MRFLERNLIFIKNKLQMRLNEGMNYGKRTKIRNDLQ